MSEYRKLKLKSLIHRDHPPAYVISNPASLGVKIISKQLSDRTVGKMCHQHCESPVSAPEKFELIEKVCQNDLDTVVVKTIRFWGLSDLAPFLDEKYDLDFKTIVLVRDPRSTYHSR